MTSDHKLIVEDNYGDIKKMVRFLRFIDIWTIFVYYRCHITLNVIGDDDSYDIVSSHPTFNKNIGERGHLDYYAIKPLKKILETYSIDIQIINSFKLKIRFINKNRYILLYISLIVKIAKILLKLI